MALVLKMKKSTRLGLMIAMVAAYFFVELIVGHMLDSATLTADSFHMLSDFVALILALYANNLAKRSRDARHTFGYQRASVVGPLVNMVMLVTLCFTIVVEALAKFYEPTRMHKPDIVLYVGLGGLAINLVGILLFQGHSHGHSHSNHGHGHGGNHVHGDGGNLEHGDSGNHGHGDDGNHGHGDDGNHGHGGNQGNGDFEHEATEVTDPQTIVIATAAPELPPAALPIETDDTGHSNDTSGHMNMHAAFLHILSDTLGSVIVILSALILWKVPDGADSSASSSGGGGGGGIACSGGGGNASAAGSCSCKLEKSHPWQAYLDPALSIVMVAIMLQTTVPTLRQSLNILMHTVPKQVSLDELNNNLKQLQGIEETHDLHVWPLQPDCLIGTVHIRCKHLPEYIEMTKAVKNIFHNFNIHCTTIQLEFSNERPSDGTDEQTPVSSIVTDDRKQAEFCSIDCGPTGKCRRRNICCARGSSEKSLATFTSVAEGAQAGADA